LTRDIGFVILRSHTETQISHMRTKTLLLTAALTAAGVATSMAQVYSVNMVGYINTSVPVGFSMIANHLNGSPDNKITTVIPAPPGETAIYKYNRTTQNYDAIFYIEGLGWDDGGLGLLDMTLGPGEGCFISAPSAFTQTFVGEVALTTSVSLQRGFQMVSSALPQSLQLDGAPNDGVPAAPVGLGVPVANGDVVYTFDTTNDNYVFHEYIEGLGWNSDSGLPPTPGVGEAFWYVGAEAAGDARTWNRNYVVGVD
jgi:hypothetical protein